VSSIEWPRDGTNWASYKGIGGAKIFWWPADGHQQSLAYKEIIFGPKNVEEAEQRIKQSSKLFLV